jgi:diguanylate cyclase (GGDEF)-like protein
VRDERDRERLARGDSERRLEREAARVDLVQQLQRRLRELPPGDLEWAAFRSVFERLLPLLQLESAALVAYGFHGFDLLLAEPISSKPHYTDLLSSRMGMMKGLARTQAPVQLQLGNGDALHLSHAVVPLPIRGPGWGVLLLRRADGSTFSDEELALVTDFGRLAVQHADEAAAALSLRKSAELDALTGTFNRRTIDLWLSRCFSEAHREDGLLSVLFVDIDHFKGINDTHGHAAGDACLRQISDVLRRQLQASDLLGRYGGEEFVIVLPGRNGDDARQLGERIRAAVELVRLDFEDKPIRLTVSVGVADAAGAGKRSGGGSVAGRPGVVCGQAQRAEPGERGAGGVYLRRGAFSGRLCVPHASRLLPCPSSSSATRISPPGPCGRGCCCGISTCRSRKSACCWIRRSSRHRSRSGRPTGACRRCATAT